MGGWVGGVGVAACATYELRSRQQPVVDFRVCEGLIGRVGGVIL